jgi:hypothetical protein
MDNVIYHFRTGKLPACLELTGDSEILNTCSPNFNGSCRHSGPEGNVAHLQGFVVVVANCL